MVLAEATGFDLQARRVELRPSPTASRRRRRCEYDSLIVAGGSAYSYFGHDGWQAHAPELKSLEGALDIRSRILTALEAAEWEPDEQRRQAWLTFVVVGAGPTGVEMAGQIAEIAHDSVREFRRVDTAAARVLLVEAADRVLTGFPPSLSASAARALEKLGVTPLVEHTVTDIDARRRDDEQPRRRADQLPRAHRRVGRRRDAPPTLAARWPTRPAPSSTAPGG